MEWDESKHPRDEDGKFTDENGGYRHNESYSHVSNLTSSSSSRSKRIKSITKQEWALWYEAMSGYYEEEVLYDEQYK